MATTPRLVGIARAADDDRQAGQLRVGAAPRRRRGTGRGRRAGPTAPRLPSCRAAARHAGARWDRMAGWTRYPVRAPEHARCGWARRRARWVLATTVLGSGLVDDRRHGGQRRAGAHRDRTGRGVRRPAVDGERLHAHPGRADPARRLAGRPLRPAPGLPDRRGLVRAWPRCCAGSRPNIERADRGPRPAGRRRRAADPGQPGADLGVASTAATGPPRSGRGPGWAGSPARSGRSSAAGWWR